MQQATVTSLLIINFLGGKQDVSMGWIILIYYRRRNYLWPTLSGILRSNHGPAIEAEPSFLPPFTCQCGRLAFR